MDRNRVALTKRCAKPTNIGKPLRVFPRLKSLSIRNAHLSSLAFEKHAGISLFNSVSKFLDYTLASR